MNFKSVIIIKIALIKGKRRNKQQSNSIIPQILMMFQKIGKEKQKFKLKLTIAKFRYQSQNKIAKNSLFKVKITKGKNEIQIFSLPYKRQSVKFSKSQYIIPLTLFYDEEKRVYLQKEAEIKVYLCDQNGNIERKIGKTELNIAEYAKKQKFGLQIDVQGQSKKFKQDAIITFQMKMERQDDDSKSVYTSSDEDFQIRSREIREIEGEASKPSKIKGKHQLISVEESKVSVKSNHSKKRQSKESDADQKYSDKTIKRNKQTSIKKQPNQNLNEENSPESLYDDRVMQRSNYPESRKNTEKPRKRQSSKSKFEKTSQSQLTKKMNQRKTVEVDQKFVEETSDISNNQSSYQSPQFKLHLAMKKIADLEKENSQLAQQSQRLKDIVEKLVSQKSQKQISDTNFSWQANQQIQKCKKSIVQKQLLINQLQNSNKKLMQQEQMKQEIIRGQKSEIKELRLKLQHEKNKLARVLQVLNDSSQKDILEQVLNEIKDEYY